MESGAQVAPPVSLPPPLARKRDLPWQNQTSQQQQHQQHQQQRLMEAALPMPGVGSWNVNAWEWDCYNFTAAPAADASGSTRVVSGDGAAEMEQRQQQKKNRGEDISKSPSSSRSIEEDAAAGLTLKLGGGTFSAAARPSKRVRSGSPGNGGNYPMCQVDDCKADLSGAKDYHRRHKVCQMHSKTTRALVGNKMQRFCQQCSRFHDLSEFDEGKRSCRRRLAGHNKRRRKPHSEEAPGPNLLPGNQENATAGSLDIVNLIATIAHLQGNSQSKPASISQPPDRDNLIQLISKIKTLNKANLSTKDSEAGSFDPDASQTPQHVPLEQSAKANDEQTVPSTMNLLAVLSTAVAASTSDALGSLSQGNSESSGNDKSKFHNPQPVADANSQKKSEQLFSSVVVGKDDYGSQSPIEVSHQALRESRSTLLLQLFGSSDDGSPPELGSGLKYMSSESSNPMEERSPSSSPPVTQKLFPLHSTAENMKQRRESRYREDNSVIELSSSLGWSTPLNLFKESERQGEHGEGRSVPFHTGFASSSGSDQSPSTSNSDAQDRTGRIIFKLFGKDPSSFPGALKAQILNWLSNSPSEMESYIRPGCVVLSVYASMLPAAWEELEENLRQRVDLLIQYPESEFWRNGRFLVRTNRQLVSHKDGKIRLSKSWRTWSAPELTSVSPVAVVSGQDTTLVLKGRNLTIPGTKIYCTYRGKYISKEVMCPYPGTIYDDSGIESFNFPGGPPKVFGRCFIEVENGFKGNSFPVIIADAGICQELRVLESDFEERVCNAHIHPDYQVQDDSRPHTKNDVLHFLNELGWLFQRTYAPSSSPLLDFSTARFKYLFTFSVEHDWCTLIKTLLDILVERSSRNDSLKQESLEMLSEIHLLNRAVKRKCRKMVDLLVHYSVSNENGSAFYPFPPDMAGPGGVTPLHLAASTQDSSDLVDALTSDPQEIGLKSWNSIRDDNNQSPYLYAMMRNHDAYNRLVARKLADKKIGQVTIAIEEEEISIAKSRTGESKRTGVNPPGARSCAQCALMGARRLKQTSRSKGLLQRPYVHSMLAIAAVCVCVCVFLRGAPYVRCIEPFKWNKVDFGTI